MAQTLTDSRFAMWRAIIALAHADGIVMPSEEEFGARYMDRTGASDAQRDILRQDLLSAHDPGTLFAQITRPEDKADFFQFARALLWCDGDFAAQEAAIIERLQTDHVGSLAPAALAADLHALRDEQTLARMKADAEAQDWAKRHVGLGVLLSRIYW